MTAVVVTCIGAALLVAAAAFLHPVAGIGVLGLFLLSAGLLVDFGDDQ